MSHCGSVITLSLQEYEELKKKIGNLEKEKETLEKGKNFILFKSTAFRQW
jgi:hypothetical protein